MPSQVARAGWGLHPEVPAGRNPPEYTSSDALLIARKFSAQCLIHEDILGKNAAAKYCSRPTAAGLSTVKDRSDPNKQQFAKWRHAVGKWDELHPSTDIITYAQATEMWVQPAGREPFFPVDVELCFARFVDDCSARGTAISGFDLRVRAYWLARERHPDAQLTRKWGDDGGVASTKWLHGFKDCWGWLISERCSDPLSHQRAAITAEGVRTLYRLVAEWAVKWDLCCCRAECGQSTLSSWATPTRRVLPPLQRPVRCCVLLDSTRQARVRLSHTSNCLNRRGVPGDSPLVDLTPRPKPSRAGA